MSSRCLETCSQFYVQGPVMYVRVVLRRVVCTTEVDLGVASTYVVDVLGVFEIAQREGERYLGKAQRKAHI